MYITSTECKTILTCVLTVMSGMDPHMISWNLGWVWFGQALSKWILLGCGLVTVRLCVAIELCYYDEFRLLPIY
jgi:hypothetical protein